MIIPALLSIFAPLLPLLVPGLAWLPRWHADHPVVLWARLAVTSLILTTLATLTGALLGLPPLAVLAILILVTAIALYLQRSSLARITTWPRIIAPLPIFFTLVLLFSLPWIFIHDGLPTGDIQKSIVWARDILETYNIPNYQRAIYDYNRDPVDFYTPGLHTTLAGVLSVSNTYAAASLFAIVVAIAVAGIVAALAATLFPGKAYRALPALSALLLLTNLRFLRYLREPGYHFQNSVGELLFFGIMLLALLLIRRWTWDNALLATAGLVALALSHQFSMFLAAFALLPFVVALVIKFYKQPRPLPYILVPLAAALIIILLGLQLNLHQKISHIFSVTPHLINELPSFAEYFSLLHPVWFVLGLSGFILLWIMILRRQPISLARLSFAAAVLILLILSQAPRLFIDIPPVRALFYVAPPLSILGAYIVLRASGYKLILALVTVLGIYASVISAFSLSHTVRTNSTLSPEQLYLVEHLTQPPSSGGILIDDYNRRSASWLMLSERPTFARLAADLKRQMDESGQSRLRLQLYLNQLDFEKIYSLGSHPAAAALMAKHNISWVAGITSSSHDAFSHNPAFALEAQAGDINLYRRAAPTGEPRSVERADTTSHISELDLWLLAASTLVNDIGDREDTLAHLPASLRSARVSEPQVEGSRTYRTTDARHIPLQFNIGDYVAALWDPEGTNLPSETVELLIAFTHPPAQPVTLTTPTGRIFKLLLDNSILKLPAIDVPFDEQGFITLTLQNPSAQLLSIDMIALGPSHTTNYSLLTTN